jgi:hypothetical protein
MDNLTQGGGGDLGDLNFVDTDDYDDTSAFQGGFGEYRQFDSTTQSQVPDFGFQSQLTQPPKNDLLTQPDLASQQVVDDDSSSSSSVSRRVK